jgi:ASCH domain
MVSGVRAKQVQSEYPDLWRPTVLRALLIRHPHIDKILDGKKTWEMRGSRTTIRGTIGLIASGSGTVIGVCDVVDCIGPLTQNEYRKNARKAGTTADKAQLGYYRQTYAWVLAKPKYLKRPVPYKHPPGAIIWVTLDPSVERRVLEQLGHLG